MVSPKWQMPPIILALLKLNKMIKLNKQKEINDKLMAAKNLLERQINEAKKTNG